MFSSAFLATALALLPSAQAFFIIGHGHALTTERLDPIVSPAVVASHVHAVVGASGFAPQVTYEDLQKSECTTAEPQADKSNYWAPSMYYRHNDTAFSAIPLSFMNAYYLNRDGPTQKKIEAFPNGLRMLAGSPYRTTFNESSKEDRAVSYVCLDYSGKVSTPPLTHYPTTNCPDGLRAQIVMPSCWDGVNLDSADHKSHMAYPLGVATDSGDCPDSHPRKLTTLFFEFVFAVNKFPGFGTDRWVFATGSGQNGMHADFMSGWDHNVLQAAMDQCTGDLFGDLAKCPPLVPSLNKAKADACKLAQPFVDEEVGLTRTLTKLPGCNPYPAGSAAAKCPNLAVPALRGFKPATPGSTDLPASASSASVSASAATHSSAAASSSSAVATPATTSPADSPASSTASTAASSSSTGRVKPTFSFSRPVAVVSPSVSVSASKTAGGAIQTPLPVPTKVPHTCKRSNRDAAALVAASGKQHKRAVHNHARRNVNRLSF